MGEAGIGKTALVELLSCIMEATFKTKIIHAGVTEQEIIELLDELTRQATENSSHRYVLFFDEINTNKLVGGLLKEILVDKRLKGQDLKENIICIGALNPYVLKSPE